MFSKSSSQAYFFTILFTLFFSFQESSIATQLETSTLPTTTTDMTKQATEGRKRQLTEMSGATNLTARDKKTLKAQAKARTLEQVGGKVVSATDKIAGYLASSNFLTNIVNIADSLSPVSFLNPLLVVGLLNNVVGVVGEGIEAYGSYKLREVALVGGISGGKWIDISDLNEATKALENIEALQQLEKKLSKQTTIKKALEKAGPKASIKKKLFIYVNKNHLSNTINRFTDELRLTDNQKSNQEKLAKIREKLNREEANYDQAIKRLQLRFLNRIVIDLKSMLNQVEQTNGNPASVNKYLNDIHKELEYEKQVKDRVTATEKNPKKLKERQEEQDIHIKRLEARLETFEKVSKNPPGAEEELSKLEKEMLDLSPQNNELPKSEHSQNLEEKVSNMEARLQKLENLMKAFVPSHH